RFILWWYAFDPETGNPVFREACFVRVKGAGKDPLAAFLCIVEFVCPCRLLGWDEDGEPVAGAHPNPLVQLAALPHEQNQPTSAPFPGMMDQACQDMLQ